MSLATAMLAAPKVVLVGEAFATLHSREAFMLACGKLPKEARVDLVFSNQDAAGGKPVDRLYRIEAGVTALW